MKIKGQTKIWKAQSIEGKTSNSVQLKNWGKKKYTERTYKGGRSKITEHIKLNNGKTLSERPSERALYQHHK